MGVELSNKFGWVKERYEQSSTILGYDVLKKQENPGLLNLTTLNISSKFKLFAKYKAAYSPRECPERVILELELLILSLTKSTKTDV